jgi:hypothetical protein
MATILYGGDDTAARRLVLEQKIGAHRVAELFDDDGDGLVAATDLATLEAVFAQADDIVTGHLVQKGRSEDTIREHLRTDRQVIRAWAGIAAQLAGERKPEWRNTQTGVGPYELDGKRAREELKMLATGELRSHTETESGGNTSLLGAIDRPYLEFAPDPNIPGDRGKGGF